MRISDWSSDVCSSDLVEIAGDREQPVEHLADRNVLHRKPAHRLAHRPQRGGEFRQIMVSGHIARLEMNFSDAAVVAGDRSEGRRGGKECVRTCRCGWSPAN